MYCTSVGLSCLAAFSVRRTLWWVCRDQACLSAADSSLVWAAPIRSVGDIAGQIYNDRAFVHKHPISILRDVLNRRGQTTDKFPFLEGGGDISRLNKGIPSSHFFRSNYTYIYALEISDV